MQALERSPAPMQPLRAKQRTCPVVYPANLASEVPRTDGNFGNREIERRVPPGGRWRAAVRRRARQYQSAGRTK